MRPANTQIVLTRFYSQVEPFQKQPTKLHSFAPKLLSLTAEQARQLLIGKYQKQAHSALQALSFPIEPQVNSDGVLDFFCFRRIKSVIPMLFVSDDTVLYY